MNFFERAFLGFLLAVNLITFFVFLFDKMIAGTGARRVPERVLYMLLFFGGTPAGLCAMALFRHKTQKTSFQAMLLLIFALQAAGVFWLLFIKQKNTLPL